MIEIEQDTTEQDKEECKFLGTAEVAQHFHVHRDTATNWCRQGLIPATKLGKKWIVLAKDLPDQKPRPTPVKPHSEPLASLEPMSVAKAWHTVWLDLFRRKR